MDEVSTIGIDLAKHVFQLHGVDGVGEVVLQRRLRRGQVANFFAALPPCVVGIEACGTATSGRVRSLVAGTTCV
jgi:transposase